MARSRIRGYGFANGRSDSSSHALAAKEKPAPVMNTTFSKELKSDSSDQVYPGPGHMWYRAVYALQVLAIHSRYSASTSIPRGLGRGNFGGWTLSISTGTRSRES